MAMVYYRRRCARVDGSLEAQYHNAVQFLERSAYRCKVLTHGSFLVTYITYIYIYTYKRFYNYLEETECIDLHCIYLDLYLEVKAYIFSVCIYTEVHFFLSGSVFLTASFFD